MAEKNNFVYGVAYGKLYLAGEYAILEDYSKALLTSVNKKITAIIEPSTTTTIFDTVHKNSVTLDEKAPDFSFIQNFLKFLNKYTKSDKTFALTIYNELHGEDKKYGLGSSGAVLVAITKAVLTFENIKFDNDIVFKIVTLFNITHNISGSQGDVAASMNKGLTYYQKFKRNFVEKLIDEKKDIHEIINSPWEGLVIENIIPKTKLTILARWTGKAVDTKDHVKLWKDQKQNYLTDYKNFVTTSNNLVEKLVSDIQTTNTSEVLNDFRQLRQNLLYLESFSKIPMETNEMKEYINNFPAGKQSGSGSGDIVLGFLENSEHYELTLNLEKLVMKGYA